VAIGTGILPYILWAIRTIAPAWYIPLVCTYSHHLNIKLAIIFFFHKCSVPVYVFFLWRQKKIHMSFKSYNCGSSSCFAVKLSMSVVEVATEAYSIIRHTVFGNHFIEQCLQKISLQFSK
jgi:hypothetical protein